MITTHDWTWLTDLPGTRGPLPRVPIRALDDLAQYSPLPLYVLLCGGIATGKTHVVRNHLTQFKVADIDDYMVRNGFTDYSRQGEHWHKAMNEISVDIERIMAERRHIVSMGTGAVYDFVKYRLFEARALGYETVILHICADLDQAISQNAERKARGDHHVRDEEIGLIENTIAAAAASVDRILREDRDLVGYLCVHENLRNPS